VTGRELRVYLNVREELTRGEQIDLADSHGGAWGALKEAIADLAGACAAGPIQ